MNFLVVRYVTLHIQVIMDYQFNKRKTGKDKERRNREINGKYSTKHIRIQDKCQENHLKNVREERLIKKNKVEERKGNNHNGDKYKKQNKTK